jgi:hypothetical protein
MKMSNGSEWQTWFTLMAGTECIWKFNMAVFVKICTCAVVKPDECHSFHEGLLHHCLTSCWSSWRKTSHLPTSLEKCCPFHRQELQPQTVRMFISCCYILSSNKKGMSHSIRVYLYCLLFYFSPGGHVITAGWGHGQGAGMLASCFLSYQEGLSIVGIEQCINAYTPPSPPSFVVRKDYHICAGSPDGRPCLGDHGGPLVCSSNPEAMMKMDGGGGLVMSKSCSNSWWRAHSKLASVSGPSGHRP